MTTKQRDTMLVKMLKIGWLNVKTSHRKLTMWRGSWPWQFAIGGLPSRGEAIVRGPAM